MNQKNMFKKFGRFLLGSPLAGGLEISDTGLRFVSAEDTVLKTANVRLAPGVMNEGRIEERAEFVQALQVLRSQILGARSRRRAPINVVVSLSSVNIYTQVFKLPFIEGENLEKAIQLNIQMASPTAAAADTYAGWQTIRNRDQNDLHLEVVTAFLQRGLADELTSALRAGGFLPIALESRALSLARLIKEKGAGINPEESLVALSADASGLDVMIVRGGHLHFDYFNSWKNLQGEERQISLDLFGTMVVRSVNQVMNFYNSHWKDPVSEIVIASTGLKDNILGAIRESFEMKVTELTPLVSPPLTPEWFVALGAALRSLVSRREDAEISLLGMSAKQEFQREEIQSFLDFWRVLVPAALSVLLAAFVAAYFFLSAFENNLAPQARVASQFQSSAELGTLRAQADHFNSAVSMIQSINTTARPKSKIFATLLEIVTRRGIGLNRLSMSDPATPIQLDGTAASEDDIIAFKSELLITPGFKDVQLPLTGIKQLNASYAFSMTFTVAP